MWEFSSIEIVTATAAALLVCSALALTVPWIVLRFSTRRAAAITAGALSIVVTILSVIYNGNVAPGLTVHLVIVVPLVVVTWGTFVFLAFLAASAGALPYRPLWMGLGAVLLAIAIFPIMGYSLAFLPSPLNQVAKVIFLWPVYFGEDIFEGRPPGLALGVVFELIYCYALVWAMDRLWNRKSAAT